MASAEASSDSDPRNRHPPHVRSDYSDTRPVSAKVQNLASTLQVCSVLHPLYGWRLYLLKLSDYVNLIVYIALTLLAYAVRVLVL